MDRREFLRTATAVGLAGGVAGCTGVLDSNSNVALGEPDREVDGEKLPYPTWGQKVPDVTLPAPLEDRTVELRSVGKPSVLTFFYSHCKTVCPVLVSTVRNVQTDSLNERYADDVAFFPTTFDPARDDADRLEAYSEKMNVDADAGNWHFLRPESKDRAKAVVQDEFGVAFERTDPEDMDMYMFTHSALTFLVNADGYVERAYRSKSPKAKQIISDLETVRT
ncbi:SCO family protein [Halorussus caseinilyticus]|uniref:SCO family protein n=1 Tax=Halorussus caseinilyticus TaxID=3034025 RepID=A0ABD5WQI0_9EURY|nr:SCO family protein [Halorussus sp. DT72]